MPEVACDSLADAEREGRGRTLDNLSMRSIFRVRKEALKMQSVRGNSVVHMRTAFSLIDLDEGCC